MSDENKRQEPEVILGEDGQPLSKQQIRKLKKQQEKERKKAAKEKAKAEKTAGTEKKKENEEEDEANIDPTAYFENRRQFAIDAEEKSGINPYPHKYPVNMSIPEVREKFSSLEDGARDETQEVIIAGRVLMKRSQGKNLTFFDLHADGAKVQLFCDLRLAEDEEKERNIHGVVKRGDIIGCRGFPGKSKRGELSVFAKEITLLSPCLRMLPRLDPKNPDAKLNPEVRYRQRYLDLILTEGIREKFYTRSKIINYVRRFLDSRGFLEVETPILNVQPGGATARPFETYHNELKQKMYMRIAPELYLKTLVVGGLDRVYEIGRLFRNEGIDLTHNPEFTTCEFYAAYWDYNDLMRITEEMISGMIKSITGSYKIKYKRDGKTDVEVNFEPPFKRVGLVEGIEERGGFKVPLPLESDETNTFLINKCKELELDCPPPLTTARLLDRMAGHFIEDQIVDPCFIIDQPELMSPLAKYHRSKPGLTERFELFVLGKEVCNAYTELNNPMVQRERFMGQAKDKAKGDDEAQMLDEDFCKALEFALPPTAGWGLGIDRMTMFLTGSLNIKEVLLFPAMKPQE